MEASLRVLKGGDKGWERVKMLPEEDHVFDPDILDVDLGLPMKGLNIGS